MASLGDGKYAVGFRHMSLATPQSNVGVENQQNIIIFTNNNIKPSDAASFRLFSTTDNSESRIFDF